MREIVALRNRASWGPARQGQPGIGGLWEVIPQGQPGIRGNVFPGRRGVSGIRGAAAAAEPCARGGSSLERDGERIGQVVALADHSTGRRSTGGHGTGNSTGSVPADHSISSAVRPMRGSTYVADEARGTPPWHSGPQPGYSHFWLPDDQIEPTDPWPPAGWFKESLPAAPEPVRVARPAMLARFAPRRVPWPWWVLWPWAVITVLLHARQAGQSWHFFAQGGQLLLGSGPGTGLHLYAAHPVLQIGPLALALAAVLRMMGPANGEITAIAAMSLTGPLVLAGVWRLLPSSERRRSTRLLFAGLLFLPVWAELTTHFGHLDDLLALCFSVAALHAVARRHPVWAGLAIAAATDAKPWAAAFVVLLLALPRRQWLTALAAFTGGVAVAWLPFLLADPRTLTAARFTIPNDGSSALRVLGISAARTPSWDRAAQLALGVAGGGLAVWRGRWQAALLVAIAARILLDPGVYAYYTAGALLGTIVVDLVVTRWRLPWTTAAAAALLYAARFTHKLIPFNLHELGELRLIFAISVPALILGVPGWWMARRRPGRHARDAQDAVPGAGGQTLNSAVRDRLAQRTSPDACLPVSGLTTLRD
ncbi:MAG TPA: glycosyltransferase family 87 protein [Streptosporangiaceae bacterium]|nr:glycosyltransferase family 87 protein [Streptosporangiaceae bacterium]